MLGIILCVRDATAHHTPRWNPTMTALSWPDSARQHAFDQWFAQVAVAHDLRVDSLRLASADASFRRYLRASTHSGGMDRIIMDSPPDRENNAAFVQVAQLLHQAGVNAPDILAQDHVHGFLLLSDLGEQTLLQALPLPEAQLHQHFMSALDELVRWQDASTPSTLPPYDHAVLMREMGLFQDWYIAQHKGLTLSESELADLLRVQERIARVNQLGPQVYVHRDFMARNLMLGHDGRLGVVDFQDALYGPVTYDIASLMRDAFHNWEDERIMDVTIRYWERVRRKPWFAFEDWSDDFGSFMRAVDWMALQRHLKILGIFARLTLRDGKPKYLADTPRFVLYARDICSRYRELTPLLRLIDRIEGLEAASGFAYGRS